VSSDVEPFREHVDDGISGRLLPLDEPGALELELGSLLTDEAEATRLGNAARAKAEAEYSPAAAAKGLRREWQALLEAR
jgi:glycosyltransferase involved in cell wall biosynthesis